MRRCATFTRIYTRFLCIHAHVLVLSILVLHARKRAKTLAVYHSPAAPGLVTIALIHLLVPTRAGCGAATDADGILT